MEELNLSRKDNEFAARLIALRKRRNWSQQFVADKLGLIDILPTPKGGGFWYQQTLHSCECLTGSAPMADAPAIFFFAFTAIG